MLFRFPKQLRSTVGSNTRHSKKHARLQVCKAGSSASPSSPPAKGRRNSNSYRGEGRNSTQQRMRRAKREEPRSRREPQGGLLPVTARLAAVRQLTRIEEEGMFASDPTKAAQQAAAITGALPPRDQANMKNLVSGVTRMKRRLDYVLSNLTQRNMSSVEPAVRQVLRLGLYELYEGLAPHAIDEFVDVAHQISTHASGYAPGFVNGVLREAGRRMEGGTLPSPLDDLEGMSASTKSSDRGLARCLSLHHSHPTWLTSRWLRRFGREQAEELMAANNRAPIYTVRVNPLRGCSVESLLARLEQEGVQARASSLLPDDFIEITSGLQTLLAKGFVARGECLVQDVSAGLVVAAALDPQPGERVLDACAAPGGKTMFCASRMQGKGHLTALDTSAARLQALTRQAEAAGVPSSLLRTQAADLREFVREYLASSKGQESHPRASHSIGRQEVEGVGAWTQEASGTRSASVAGSECVTQAEPASHGLGCQASSPAAGEDSVLEIAGVDEAGGREEGGITSTGSRSAAAASSSSSSSPQHSTTAASASDSSWGPAGGPPQPSPTVPNSAAVSASNSSSDTPSGEPPQPSPTVPNSAAVSASDSSSDTPPQPSTAAASASESPEGSSGSLAGGRHAPPLWDRVLLDAPCSGSGVLAKRADMRWRRTAEDVQQVLVPLQAELLDAAAQLVREGGVLVYSICSIEEDEGPQQVQAFLARHKNYRHEPIGVAEQGAHSYQAVVSPEGSISTFPHLHGVGDGSYAARLRRIS